MPIELEKVPIERKSVIRNLMELYLYDLNEFEKEKIKINEYGRYEYEWLDHYWTDESRYPFTIKVDDNLAGFVLVRGINTADSNSKHSITEFFVMKNYRGQGIGKKVAFKILDMFKGEWEISEIPNNFPSHIFWRKVISEYTKGKFKEIIDNNSTFAA